MSDELFLEQPNKNIIDIKENIKSTFLKTLPPFNYNLTTYNFIVTHQSVAQLIYVVVHQ